jgi:drug/metabolite transporter (DMT)-like permease
MPRLHIIRAILLLLAMSLYCCSLSRLHIAVVASLNFVIPLFTLILASIFLKEKINKGNIIATVIGFAGVCIVFEPQNSAFATCFALVGLLSAALFAALDVINKRFVSNEGVFQMVFYTATITLVLSLPFALFRWATPPLRDVCLFALLGVGANFLLYCILKAFERVDVSTVAPLRYFELILTILTGFLVFGEIPRKSTVIGALIIISSVLYVVIAGTEVKK